VPCSWIGSVTTRWGDPLGQAKRTSPEILVVTIATAGFTLSSTSVVTDISPARANPGAINHAATRTKPRCADVDGQPTRRCRIVITDCHHPASRCVSNGRRSGPGFSLLWLPAGVISSDKP